MIKLNNMGWLGVSALALALTLAGCGGGGNNGSGSNPVAQYTVGGTVTGLNGAVVLKQGGSDVLTVNADGGFTFTDKVTANDPYAVTVASQPMGQVCTVSNGSGPVMVNNVTNVKVTCSNLAFSVAGTVSGLTAGQNVVLQNNGADTLSISANGVFSFPTPVAGNSGYNVTILTQPAGDICTVMNGYGSGVVANISNIAVACSTVPVTIGGTVSGLPAGQQITLLNNGGDPVTVTANGSYTFPIPIVANSGYNVTIAAQPVGVSCSITNPFGAGVVANVNNVAVNCSPDTYTVSGTVTGLTSGQQVTLNDNGSDPLTINANGSFTFAAPIAFNGSYVVTVGTQPTMQTCTVSNATGAGMVAAISNVTVNCSTTAYTLSGTVYGLNATEQVTINNNGGNPMTIYGNGGFSFNTPVVVGSSYVIAVGTQPTGETCSVSNGVGGPVTGNVSGIAINCSTSTFGIGGTISGLNAGEQVTLNLNGSLPTTFTSNGGFTMANRVVYGASYAVSVGTQPVAQTCTVANGSGSNVTGNVGSVAVTCSGSTESVFYSFAGLNLGTFDGGNPSGGLTLGSDGNFYGFTNDGGPHGNGTLFKLTPSGTETVVYGFGAISNDGVFPQGHPVQASDGNFYGVTRDGGANNQGTIFKITPAGTETILYSFSSSGTNGFLPGAGLVLGSDGNFYGTTQLGGAYFAGVVFKVATDGTYTQLYSFNPGTNDAYGIGAELIQGTDGNFYGAAYYGGTGNSGAIFEITPAGTESVLYSFTGGNDGKYPAGALLQGTDGNFYGTTYKGGSNGVGVAYAVTPAGTPSVLYTFGSNDAQEPNGPLIQAPDGNFYGISQYGGTNSKGTIFKITPAGVESVLWSFGGSGDGQQAFGALLIGADGHFYGTTSNGGAYSNGTVFKY